MRMKTIFAFIGFALCISTSQKISASDVSTGAPVSDSSSSSGATQVAPPEFRQDACPAELVDWANDDFKDHQGIMTLGIKYASEAKTCTSVVKNYESYVQKSGKKTTLSDSEAMGNYLANRYKQVAPTAANVLRNCNNLPEGKDKIVKTRYYMAMSKMEAVNSTLLDEISSIDSLVPNKPQTKNLDCSTIFPFPKVGQKCEDYKTMLNGSCKQTAEQRMKDLVAKTKSIIPQIDELNGALEKCQAANKATPETCQPIAAVIQMLKAQVPWADGTEFDKSYHDVRSLPNQTDPQAQARAEKMKDQKIQEGITRQLYYNRNKYVDEYKKNIKQAKCLTYTKADGSAPCDFEDTRQYIAQLPDITIPSEPTAQGREYDKYVEAENCLVDRGEDRAQTDSTVSGAARDAALTVVTGGTSAAVKYGGLRVIKGMSTASKLKTASLVESGMAAVNLGAGFKDAANQCAGKTKSLLKFSEKPQDVAKDNVCPVSTSNIGLAEDDNTSCLVSALLTGAGVWPFVKGLKMASQFSKFSKEDLLKLYKDPSQRAAVEKILAKNGNLASEAERADAAESLVGRKLTSEEKACVSAAHNIAPGKAFNTPESVAAGVPILSTADLSAKMGSLVGCGSITLTEASLFMRAGVTGNTPEAAGTFIRQASTVVLGRDLTPTQVQAVWDSAGKNGSQALDLLKKAGFSDAEAAQIASGKLNLKADDVKGVTLGTQPSSVAAAVPAAAAPVKVLAAQADFNRALTRGDSAADTQAAYKAMRAETLQKVQSGGLANDPATALTLTTQGLKPSEAVDLLGSSATTGSGYTNAMAAIDSKMKTAAQDISGAGAYAQYQYQQVRVQLMDKHYAGKFGDKWGSIDMDKFYDADEAGYEAYENAKQLLENMKAKAKKNWPGG